MAEGEDKTRDDQKLKTKQIFEQISKGDKPKEPSSCLQGHITNAMRLLSALCVVSLLAGCKVASNQTDVINTTVVSQYQSNLEICIQEGIVDATSASVFSPDDPLTCDELQVMLIRLYDRLHGGNGTIPPLPDDSLDYLQFLDPDGSCVARITDIAEVYTSDGGLWVEFKRKPTVDELTLKVAFPGDKMYLCTQGYFVSGGIENGGDPDPHSAAGVLQMISPETQYGGVVIPDHYVFSMEADESVDLYVRILSSYRFMVENDWFDDCWDAWYYPYVYYWNYREGNYLTESSPREKEDPEFSPADTAWWEDMAIYLGTYCPEVVPRVEVTEEMMDDRYTYSQNKVIRGLLQTGILTENDDRDFEGQQPITKAEAISVIARVLRDKETVLLS